MGSPMSLDATGPPGNSRPAENTERPERQPRTGLPPDVAGLIRSILEELQGSRTQRVDWVHEQAQGFAKWEQWRTEFIRGINATLRGMRDDGWEAEAAQVEAGLSSSRAFTHPGEFNFYWTTQHGHENVTIWLEGTGAQRTPDRKPSGGDTDDHAGAGSAGESDEEDDDEVDRSDVVCPMCRSPGREKELLACDRCRIRFHTGCLGLKEAPAAGWTCRWCDDGDSAGGGRSPAGEVEAETTPKDACEGSRGLMSCLSDPVDIDFGADHPEPQAVATGRQWVARTTSGQCFYIGCCTDAIVVPTLYTASSKPTHELIPRNFDLDPSDVNNVLDHLRVQHGIARVGNKQVRNLMKLVSMVEPLAWSIAANNMCVREIQGLRMMAWDSLMVQYRSGTDQGPGTRTVLRSSAARFGAGEALFRWPEGGDDMWLISCTSPDCNQGPMGSQALDNGEAAAHFRTHGLELGKDQIINLFGFRIIHDEVTAEEHRPGTGSSSVVGKRSGPSAHPPPPAAGGEQDTATMTAAKAYRTCIPCSILHRKCDKRKPSCGTCLLAERTCSYDMPPAQSREGRRRLLRGQRCGWCRRDQPKYTHGPFDLCATCSRLLTKATKRLKPIAHKRRPSYPEKPQDAPEGKEPVQGGTELLEGEEEPARTTDPAQGKKQSVQDKQALVHSEKELAQGSKKSRPSEEHTRQAHSHRLNAVREYSMQPVDMLIKMCDSRGISTTGLPSKGKNMQLAWKLVWYDENGSLPLTKSKDPSPQSKPKGNTNARESAAVISELPRLGFLDYMKLGNEEMKRRCEKRGISLTGIPSHGRSAWLAGKLRDYDVRGIRAQTAS